MSMNASPSAALKPSMAQAGMVARSSVPSKFDSISSAPPSSFNPSRIPAKPTPTFLVLQNRSSERRGGAGNPRAKHRRKSEGSLSLMRKIVRVSAIDAGAVPKPCF